MEKGGKKLRVMGFGTFDKLHPGHLDFLRQLSELGDETIVLVARDENVKRLKSRLPGDNEKKRMKAVKATGLVTRVILGESDDFYRPILDVWPDAIGLGYDQKADIRAIQNILPGVKIIRLRPFMPNKYKSHLFQKGKP